MEIPNVFAAIKENDLKVLMSKIYQLLNHVFVAGNAERTAVEIIRIEYFYVEKL